MPCQGIAFLVVSNLFFIAEMTLSESSWLSLPLTIFISYLDTVNFASRMESTSIRMKIQVSELTYRLLQDSPNMIFDLDQRREGENIGIEVKGKGHQITYVCL